MWPHQHFFNEPLDLDDTPHPESIHEEYNRTISLDDTPDERLSLEEIDELLQE